MGRLEDVERNARRVLDDIPEERTYHNINHVENVVQKALELGEYRGLSAHELELLLSAAWFHDLGYATGPADGHEERSQALVDELLDEFFTDAERDRIKEAIAATEWPQQPTSELGEFLADADVHTLGTVDAEQARRDVFEELRQTEYPGLSWREFIRARVDMFADYTFHTPEARERFQDQKDANIQMLRDELPEESSTEES